MPYLPRGGAYGSRFCPQYRETAPVKIKPATVDVCEGLTSGGVGPTRRWLRRRRPPIWVTVLSPPSHGPLTVLTKTLEYAFPHKQYQGSACRYLSQIDKLEKSSIGPPSEPCDQGYETSQRVSFSDETFQRRITQVPDSPHT